MDRRRTRAEKKSIRARNRRWRRGERREAWQSFKKRMDNFLAHPFAKKKLSSFKLNQQYYKRLMRRDRRIARQKWWAKFRKNPWRAVFPKHYYSAEDRGNHYIQRTTRLEKKALALKRRKANRENFRKLFANRELRNKLGFSFLHSTAYFILAFILIYIIYQLITILVASSYDIPVIWYYYKLKFPLYSYSHLYTREALVIIFASGPVISLMLAFVFLKLFFTQNPVIKRFQLFYLWGFICGINMFFGAYIAGFFTRTEFIYTSEWLFMSNAFDFEEIVFTVISFSIMLIVGRIVTPLFLLSSGSVTFIKPEFRLFFIYGRVIFPWMAGMIVLTLITLPTWYFPLILKTITPVLILIPPLFLSNSLHYDNIHKSGTIQQSSFRWSIVILVIAILFFYRLILSYGLKLM
jgi:hypothetical protein